MDVVEVLALLLMLSTMELGQVSRKMHENCRNSNESSQDYSTELLTETQRVLLEDLRDYGLVWQRNVCRFRECGTAASDRSQSKSRRFHPTRLATTLTSALPSLIPSTHASRPAADTAAQGSGAPDQQGFIIIETNYRLYAYTGERLS